MRVSNSPVQNGEVHKAKKGTKAEAADEAARKPEARGVSADAAESTRAELSSKGKELAQAKSAAANAPDVREEKIAALKRRVAEGSYKVDAGAVADRMVDEHLSSGIG